MTYRLIALACLTALTVAACSREEPAAPADAAPAAAETAPATVDIVPTGESPDNAEFDVRAFAGTFSGTLPCASCPGIDTTLVLNPDGTYAITETYQDEAGAPAEMDGTWTVEVDGKQIRLDPNSKSEDDRLFAIDSDDRITQLSADGTPAESGLDYGLERQPAG